MVMVNTPMVKASGTLGEKESEEVKVIELLVSQPRVRDMIFFAARNPCPATCLS
ncbi:hypothetical protein AUEXF2481DRAFT_35692 [Aureobasidium subglaciale EXF-2481]|uniref:Uncharacterized protein n=1 Tax=Aureobasidium subglaciale (strain EXF-2481) TaxID=1043005 RepID=A0A074YUB9_AURSE|nr:uncharacterized protein AUEXF2481DRAFT_35692 [Aureobasidium subglaciale EXF-2481]KEQ99759.1 hypothetical protein AUEXF2481DRAFT_35692 [Aureobasidium subglaciale EXF-2481]